MIHLFDTNSRTCFGSTSLHQVGKNRRQLHTLEWKLRFVLVDVGMNGVYNFKKVHPCCVSDDKN
jgi:hypothetical protein